MLCAHVDTVQPDGADRAGGGRRHRHERGAPRSSAATTRPPSPRCSRACAAIVAEGRPHAGIELILTVQEEIGLLGAKAFDCAAARRADRLRLRPRRADRRPRHRLPVAVLDRRDVPSARSAHCGHRAGGGPQRDRRGRARARRDALRPPRRRDDRQRRHRSRAASRATSSPTAASCGSRCARSTPPSARSRSARSCSTRSRTPRTPTSASSRRPSSLEYVAYKLRRTDPVVQIAWRSGARGLRLRARAASSRAAAPTPTSSTPRHPCVNLCNGMELIHTADEQHRRRRPRRRWSTSRWRSSRAPAEPIGPQPFGANPTQGATREDRRRQGDQARTSTVSR